MWTGSFAVATACLIIAVLFPVRCAVTTRQCLPCRNPANGVLFGCGGSGHTWIKFRAHFGRHERLQAWLTFVATGAGTISMTTDVIGLFG